MLAVLLAALESDTDRQKFIEIYEKYHVQMERTAMRILKEQSDVEDAVQNAFMQMIRHFEKIFEIPCEELPFWIIWNYVFFTFVYFVCLPVQWATRK